MESRNVLPAAIVLAAAIAAGGWLVGQGLSRFKSDTRTVTVKGLVEREVKSDLAAWALNFRRASDTLAEAHQRVAADRDAVLAFLKDKGFAEAEIERLPTRTLDKLASDFGQDQGERFRYVVTSAVEVTSGKVDLVRAATGATEELLKAGVILDSENQTGRANPRFVVSRFNDLRPALLAAATKNARSFAEPFASTFEFELK
jgi:hypothetical protein